MDRNRSITALHLLFIERTPDTIALQTSTSAPYRIVPSPSLTSVSAQFDRGLLTDGQWSAGEWQPQLSVGWLDPSAWRFGSCGELAQCSSSVDQHRLRSVVCPQFVGLPGRQLSFDRSHRHWWDVDQPRRLPCLPSFHSRSLGDDRTLTECLADGG